MLPLLIPVAIGVGAAGYAIYRNLNSTPPTSETGKSIMLFEGEQEAGKSAVVNWIFNGKFKPNCYSATEKHKKIVGVDFILYDTADTASGNADREKLERDVLASKDLKKIYVFDVSKYNDKETKQWITMLQNQKRYAEKLGCKLDIIAIGTHANESGLSKEQIASLEKEIRNFGTEKCRIYELNPDERKDFHPPLSSSEIKNYILE